MVEYLWSGQHANHVAPSLLSPTSVTWALPRSVLNRAFRATVLSKNVYDCLLRPPWLNGGLEFFFLQDLITFVNGCGWAGKLQQVGPPLPSLLPSLLSPSLSQSRYVCSFLRVCGGIGRAELLGHALVGPPSPRPSRCHVPARRTLPARHHHQHPSRLRHVRLQHSSLMHTASGRTPLALMCGPSSMLHGSYPHFSPPARLCVRVCAACRAPSTWR
jgi:hypothetical protein